MKLGPAAQFGVLYGELEINYESIWNGCDQKHHFNLQNIALRRPATMRGSFVECNGSPMALSATFWFIYKAEWMGSCQGLPDLAWASATTY